MSPTTTLMLFILILPDKRTSALRPFSNSTLNTPRANVITLACISILFRVGIAITSFLKTKNRNNFYSNYSIARFFCYNKKYGNKKHHKISTFELTGNHFYFWLDMFLVFASIVSLIGDFFKTLWILSFLTLEFYPANQLILIPCQQLICKTFPGHLYV